MAKVSLKPVTVDNWKDCIKLQLDVNQEKFLPNNLYSIAEAQFYPEARSRAIYNESTQIVGYTLFGRDVITKKWKVFRLMIDKAYQGRGYGETAMKEIITEIVTELKGNEILVCYQKPNQVAKRLYAKLGFIEQEVDSEGRVTAQLKVE
jgi:diamine N-acetyltransferase